MAKHIDLLIDQGSTYSNTILAIANTDLTVNGYSCAALMKKSYTSTNSFSLGTTLNSNGTITLSYSASASANTPYGDYVYDVLLTTPSGSKMRIQEGFAIIRPEVT